MLLFELFPLFITVLTLLVGVWLIVAHRAAGREEAEEAERRDRPT
jgi:hypothetical protein